MLLGYFRDEGKNYMIENMDCYHNSWLNHAFLNENETKEKIPTSPKSLNKKIDS